MEEYQTTPIPEQKEEQTHKPQVTLFSDKQFEAMKVIVSEIIDTIKQWVTKKYSHDFTGLIIFGLIVGAILTTICVLACNGKITEPTIGTILGSLIGYALGKFNTSQSKERQ